MGDVRAAVLFAASVSFWTPGLQAAPVGTRGVSGLVYSTEGAAIDHPLDPENRTLSHSFVESPDMKNVYDGVVTTDAAGYATVELPDWFGALNRDFRYRRFRRPPRLD